MSKPSKPVLLSSTSPGLVQIEVLAADGVYQVYYQGQAIALRHSSQGSEYKYPKSCFPQRGHAQRLADRLNTMFDTTQFQVREIH